MMKILAIVFGVVAIVMVIVGLHTASTVNPFDEAFTGGIYNDDIVAKAHVEYIVAAAFGFAALLTALLGRRR